MANLYDVIKYEGDNRTFVWKHPAEDFNTATQLIVHESQEAVFFLNGQALDLFGPGRHTLETQNIPLIRHFYSLPAGGESPFHAEVYFINLVEQMGISWGTNSKVQFMEPTYGFPLAVGASGEMALAVRDSRKLLVKIVGTEAVLNQDRLINYFKAFLQTRIKSALAQTIANKKYSIFELDSRLDELSQDVKARLQPDFAEYGLELTQMLVTTIVRPEDDPIYRRFKDLYFRQFADVREAEINQQVGVINQETAAKRTVIEAQANAAKRQVEGYTYQEERGFDVAEKVAANEAVGEFSNLGIGLGMIGSVGVPVGSAVGAVMSDAMGGANLTGAAPVAAQPVSQEAGERAAFCTRCGYRFTGDEAFCPKCGTRRS